MWCIIQYCLFHLTKKQSFCSNDRPKKKWWSKMKQEKKKHIFLLYFWQKKSVKITENNHNLRSFILWNLMQNSAEHIHAHISSAFYSFFLLHSFGVFIVDPLPLILFVFFTSLVCCKYLSWHRKSHRPIALKKRWKKKKTGPSYG